MTLIVLFGAPLQVEDRFETINWLQVFQMLLSVRWEYKLLLVTRQLSSLLLAYSALHLSRFLHYSAIIFI